ncbi:MAG: orotidine 5'-phosphate decarboxylase [Nitrososphaeria archaeon]|nr:orotidine 5'-phosphate decarboxylase [Nitrososphaeria archaeon]
MVSIEDFVSPKLQLALDLLELESALKVAFEAKDYVDILEAGTPLIKSVGIPSIRTLKKVFSDKIILADMKTLDVGYIEVSMAADAGADIVSISGLAPNDVVKEAVRGAREKGVLLMADLLGVKSQVERAIELKGLGVNMVCAHTAIDQERSGASVRDNVEIVRNIAELTGLIVSAAGGITLETAGLMIEAGAKIIVVGRAITSSKDPKNAAAKFKKEILEHSHVKK